MCTASVRVELNTLVGIFAIRQIKHHRAAETIRQTTLDRKSVV